MYRVYGMFEVYMVYTVLGCLIQSSISILSVKIRTHLVSCMCLGRERSLIVPVVSAIERKCPRKDSDGSSTAWYPVMAVIV